MRTYFQEVFTYCTSMKVVYIYFHLDIIFTKDILFGMVESTLIVTFCPHLLANVSHDMFIFLFAEKVELD